MTGCLEVLVAGMAPPPSSECPPSPALLGALRVPETVASLVSRAGVLLICVRPAPGHGVAH